MTKRALYASWQAVLLLAPVLVAGPPAVRAQGAACATCLAPVVTPAGAALFPGRLDGFDVLVGASGGDARAALDHIRSRGGRPGLWLERVPDPVRDAALLAGADVIAIAPAAADDTSEARFALRKQLASIRGATRSGTALGILVRSEAAARELAPYLDFLVLGAGTPSFGVATEWRTIAAADPAAAIAATAKADAARWIWLVSDDDAAVRALAALTQPADRPVEDVRVLGARRPTAAEIVARHQAAAARQAAAVTSVISSGSLTITFEAPGFAAPVTVASDVVIYAGADHTDLEHRRVRINGVAFREGGVPQLPIIEPERAASPPLAITLTSFYRYELADEQDVDGRRCFVIAFDPAPGRAASDGASLFAGRAWIDAKTFAMVKVAARQTGLKGPIVSSEQIDEFREAADGVWLLHRSEIRQLYEGAGHRTPIVRVLSMAAHETNPPEFGARRAAAYASSRVMLRDTPAGYRYLKRERGQASAIASPPVVVSRVSRVRTIAAGLIVDPNISVPLPFAGLSYVDFDLFGTGSQLNAFLGGSYGQLAVSVPSLGGTRWQLGGRAFAIASSYNDRAFEDGRERYDRNIVQRPANASVWLVRPLTSRTALRLGYDLDYTHFERGAGTAVDFVEPPSQLVHGARIAIDGQWRGWTASVWWNPARRQHWRPWGLRGGGEYDPSHVDFQRYGAQVARSRVVRPGVIARVEAAWMGGGDLDRFSRYAFGSFDNRLRGYPAALIRYDRGGVTRAVGTWAPRGRLRLAGFFDAAAVRDAGYGGRVRRYTGVGAAIETAAPFGTLVAVEWGYGFRGVNADGRLGTQVVRVSAFKVF